MSVAPYSFATLTQFGLVPTANILPAPRFLAPATEHNPTGPIPITATVEPNFILAFSDPSSLLKTYLITLQLFLV